jgi:Transposase DDE domain
MAFKKKLYSCRPRHGADDAERYIESQYSRRRTKQVAGDPVSIERGVRQMLADKVTGHLVGLWLLVPEHLRLGTWDLVRSWTGQSAECLEPRLALQLVHEAALCSAGVRRDRTMTNRGGFELVNGLPFIGSDATIHHLLAAHTTGDARQLQVQLGKLRRAGGDLRGRILAVDPHRVKSYSQRHMRMHVKQTREKPTKMAQTFWLLDAETQQPVCFTTATAARTVAQATPDLLDLAGEILGSQTQPALVLADTEHYTADLLDDVTTRSGFELLVPMSNSVALQRQLAAIPSQDFTPRWAGFATMKRPYVMKRGTSRSLTQYVQRSGERPDDYDYKAFLATCDGDEVELLTEQFPKRWHVEEFFNNEQALGWQRAGTMNLNIRYGQMSMALIGQAVIHQLRTRLEAPYSEWNAKHLAKDLLQGLDGDIRVTEDTIIVTYYNAPNKDQLRRHYEGLPQKLLKEGVSPGIPWLYGYQLDFRFQ